MFIKFTTKQLCGKEYKLLNSSLQNRYLFRNLLFRSNFRRFGSMDFDPNVDYYSILGVKKFASRDEVKKKYLELVKKYHPDINPAADQNKFKSITAAYTVLSNESTKSRYDASKRGSTFNSRGTSGTNYRTQSQQRTSNYQNYGQRTRNFYENAKQNYQNQQNYKKAEEAYKKWFQDAQKRRREQEFEQQQYQRGKQYYSYEEFKRDFDKQDNRTYQQNWDSSQSNSKYQRDFERDWESIRNEYHRNSFSGARGSFLYIYWRVVIFFVGILVVENIIRRMRYVKQQRDLIQFYGNPGLEGSHIQQFPIHNTKEIIQNHPGTHAYRVVPDMYRKREE
ncbi:unnamed protein product [Moneuplotes crassus]|uniref:J domain-containing protein n=1 Tax=Euplotes crassus TaxID=5936 RepID=A0AAD1XLV1_EUPCR|nr:unnamed protein product [Moneuplotes crassus]